MLIPDKLTLVYLLRYQYCIFLSLGNLLPTSSAIMSVSEPPMTTDRTTPKILAATPLSNCPNSLLDIMKIELTLSTRPLMFSGVLS